MLHPFPIPRDTASHLLLFCLLTALALALRFQTLDAVSETVYANFLLPDERYYHDWAVDLLNNNSPVKVFEYAPLPAYLMALVYKVVSIDINHIRIANILLNTLGCMTIYAITRLLTSRSWALVALAMAACTRELVFYSVVPLKTSLAFFLFALLAYLTLLSLHRFSRLLLIAIGILLGLSMAVRPNVLILLPLLPVVIIALQRRHLNGKMRFLVLLLTGVGFAGALLPLSLHNYLHSRQFSVLPVQSGFLFYCTNTIGNPTPLYRPVPFASSLPEEQGIHFIIEASRKSKTTMDAGQASSYWRRQVMHEALDNPLHYLKKIRDKTLMLVNASENGDHYHIGFMSNLIPKIKMLPFRYWYFLVLGYAAMIIGWNKSREIRCLASILVAYLTTLLLYSTGNRFTLPLLALLIPAAAWLGHHLYRLVSTASLGRLATIFLFPALLFCIGRLPVEGTGDLSKHFNNLAFIHNQKGDSEAAVRYWQQSADLKQTYSDVALLFLAGHHYRQQGPHRAIETLQTIPDASFMAAAKYATLGDIFLHHDQREQALEAYRRSLALNSGQRRVRQQRIAILGQRHPKEAQEEKLALQAIQRFYK